MGESSQVSSLGEELEAICVFSEMKIYSFPGMSPLINYPIHVVLAYIFRNNSKWIPQALYTYAHPTIIFKEAMN